MDRFRVVPAIRQHKPYPLYQLYDGQTLLLEADKESCYIYAFGLLGSLVENLVKSEGKV